MKVISVLFYVFSILGAIVGAGFMSGTEIYSFFSRFGAIGYIGIAVNCILYSLCMVIYHLKNAKSYNLVLQNEQKPTILSVCQLCMCASMVAGLTELFAGFGISKVLVAFVVLILLFVALCFGVRGANVFNVFVSACLILSIPFVVYDGGFRFLPHLDSSLFAVVAMSISYVAMNMVSSLPIIRHVCEKNSTKNVIVISVVLGFLMFLILTLFAGFCGSDSSMPILNVIQKPWFKTTYSVLVSLAMVSTLLSSGVGAKLTFSKFGNLISSFFVSVLSVLFSFVGFKNIITYVYPVIGGVVLIRFVVIICCDLFCKKQKTIF